jgi:hypothetical protein
MAKYKLQMSVPWEGLTPDTDFAGRAGGEDPTDVSNRILSKAAVVHK